MTETRDADVIVIGAGPGGSATAFHLARHGVRVELLEKSEFPREKVCGDGLTPRAVKQLVNMGVDTSAEGWVRNKGLRVIGGGMRLELPWPELASYPDYGLTRTRLDFDEILARNAQKAGAQLHERTAVTGPVLDAGGRIVGVTAIACCCWRRPSFRARRSAVTGSPRVRSGSWSPSASTSTSRAGSATTVCGSSVAATASSCPGPT